MKRLTIIVLLFISVTSYANDVYYTAGEPNNTTYGRTRCEAALVLAVLDNQCSNAGGIDWCKDWVPVVMPLQTVYIYCKDKTSDGKYVRIPIFTVGYNCNNPGEKFNFITLACEIPPPPEDNPSKNEGCPGDNGAGNPCNVATGNKYQRETDISDRLSFVRSYNSQNLVDLGLGKGWRSAYQKHLSIFSDELTLINGAGRGEPWHKSNGVWTGDADSDFIITENASTGVFTVTTQNGGIERYNDDGQITSETDRQGKQTTYAYNIYEQLNQVTNHFGHRLTFTYDTNEHLQSVTDANNARVRYEYDANDNLTGVVYPDTTPGNDNDNPGRIYHYENTAYPHHLTGITDENGDRFATYAYDANGQAILTRHAQTSGAVGQAQFQLDYQGQ